MSYGKQVKAVNCHCNPLFFFFKYHTTSEKLDCKFKVRETWPWSKGLRQREKKKKKIGTKEQRKSPREHLETQMSAHPLGCWCDGRPGPGSPRGQWAGRWGCPWGSHHREGYTGTDRPRSSQTHRSFPGTSSRMDLVLSGDSLLSPTEGFMKKMRKVLPRLWSCRDSVCQNPIVQ